ncbi:MAG: 4-hydroxy-3-methylbut-2-enyl diphosphate reductase [Coriobacteriales bacterium]|jgi:4-hydroxy-3-methylbut-2-enyl diphosphate reductase|nr:4-hydroxy-3-methylbut-2-enyl diphosphate reductase [Coriobacteriales bacterium]
MQIILSRYAGACYGVERALSLVEEAAANSGPVSTLGQLIHNPQVVAALEARGIRAVEGVADADGGALVIRSHGVAPEVIDAAREQGLEVIDATCPHVSAAQQAARELSEQGYTVVVVGEQGHPEVEAIRAWAGDGTLVVQEPADLEHKGDVLFCVPDSGNTGVAMSPESRHKGEEHKGDVPFCVPDVRPADDALSSEHKRVRPLCAPPLCAAAASPPVGLVVQTTQSPAALEAIVAALRQRGIEPQVRNTICSATRQRQQAAAELAANVNLMLVVGGRNSGNTTRLSEICSAVCPATYHIESPAEIESHWLAGVEKVGITAGASTPEAQIAAVVKRLEQIGASLAGNDLSAVSLS